MVGMVAIGAFVVLGDGLGLILNKFLIDGGAADGRIVVVVMGLVNCSAGVVMAD